MIRYDITIMNRLGYFEDTLSAQSLDKAVEHYIELVRLRPQNHIEIIKELTTSGNEARLIFDDGCILINEPPLD